MILSGAFLQGFPWDGRGLREATFEPYPAETAGVYVSNDGAAFVKAGSVSKDGQVSLPADMPVARDVKLVDTSKAAIFTGDTDGYDVDGVRAMNRCGAPHPAQAKTSKANVRRSSPAQSTRGVRSFFGSAFTSASGDGLASCGFGSAPAGGSATLASSAPAAWGKSREGTRKFVTSPSRRER